MGLNKTITKSTEEIDTLMKAKLVQDLQINHKLLSELIKIADILRNVKWKICILFFFFKKTIQLHNYKVLDTHKHDTIKEIFIKSETTGIWQMQLYAVKQILRFFATTGHNLCPKSAKNDAEKSPLRDLFKVIKRLPRCEAK